MDKDSSFIWNIYFKTEKNLDANVSRRIKKDTYF
jgi:hypothetical protein